MAVAAPAGCGGPAELNRDQAETLASARERLDDALETHEICRTDKTECRRLVREVRRYATQPSRLEKLVPSVVTPTGNVYPAAYRAFVGLAVANPRAALQLPAAREVERMASTLEGADPDTRISTLENQRAADYLAEAQRDTGAVWPDLARVLGRARAEL